MASGKWAAARSERRRVIVIVIVVRGTRTRVVWLAETPNVLVATHV